MAAAPCIDIDLSAVRHNLAVARRAAPGRKVFAVIKANAYGHGDRLILDALADADAIAVARLSEGINLRQHGYARPILVLGVLDGVQDLVLAAEHSLDVTLSHVDQLPHMLRAEVSRALSVWIKIDTGMHRLGIRPDELQFVLSQLEAGAWSGDIGLMTHFANADQRDGDETRRQLELFETVTSRQPFERSLCNSAGILAWPDAHADWVRPGIMLYGSSPFAETSARELDLKPVMTFRSELVSLNHLIKGDAVGYGGDWVCPQDMLVGVAAVGYGDGYPRHAPNGTPVLVNGLEVPLAGRVSMDLITLDLRSQPQARVGDPVVLWGKGLAADRVAAAAGTISYELFCGITGRVERRISNTD